MSRISPPIVTLAEAAVVSVGLAFVTVTDSPGALQALVAALLLASPE